LKRIAFFFAAALLFGATAHGQSGADPIGFTDQLNAARVGRGLAPVSYNSSSVGAAAANNAQQLVRGLGHFVTGGFAQCAGVGQPDSRSVLNAWSMSPGHAAILFSPQLVSVGYHQSGVCHTVSCLMGFAQPQPQTCLRQVPIGQQPCRPYRCYPAR